MNFPHIITNPAVLKHGDEAALERPQMVITIPGCVQWVKMTFLLGKTAQSIIHLKVNRIINFNHTFIQICTKYTPFG